MKIGIFSPYSIAPKHMRLEMVEEILISQGHQVSIVHCTTPAKSFSKKLNAFTLFYFDWPAIFNAVKQLRQFDIIYIQDLKLLPLSIFAQWFKRKPVIYETLDNNVHLQYYSLQKKSKVWDWCRCIIPLFSMLERSMARRCTAVIVNSNALYTFFKGKAEVIFYASPFEDIINNTTDKVPSALLFLGAFSKQKGSVETLELQQKLGIPLYVFGEIADSDVKQRVLASPDITYQERLNSTELPAAND